MTKKKTIWIAAGLWALSAAAMADDAAVNRSIDQVLGDHSKYETVIRQFQSAVVAHDAKAVAALIEYPINVTIGGHKTTLKNAAAFIPHYDQIVTPAIAKVIGAQKYDALMVNAQGVMFGSGEAWISGICLDKECHSVNVRVTTLQAAAAP